MMSNIAVNMNAYLSDLVVFYLKLHDLHWNVKGPQFVEVHKYTEAQYEGMAEKFDEIAELVLMHGEKPVSSIREYLELASIQELCKESYRDGEVLQILSDDLNLLKAEAEKLRSVMAENDVFDIVAVLEEHVAGYNKELWFLRSMMA